MENTINNLISKVKLLENNKYYRYGDTIYHKGNEWNICVKNIVRKDKFKNTILRQYFDKCPHKNLRRPPPFIQTKNILNEIVNRMIENNKDIKLPDKNEIVIHLRLGDTCGWPKGKKKNYFQIIDKLLNKFEINKISFVTAFHYDGSLNDTTFSDKSFEKNKLFLKEFLGKFFDKYKNINIDIVSNKNVDHDFIYMLKSQYFISDFKGFSKLICNCRGRKSITF